MSYFHFRYGFGIIGLLNWVSQVCRADVAQLVEQLFCKQQVAGSSPIAGSSRAVAREKDVWVGARVVKGAWL